MSKQDFLDALIDDIINTSDLDIRKEGDEDFGSYKIGVKKIKDIYYKAKELANDKH